MQLVSKISNLCGPDPPTSQAGRQTDRQVTCNRTVKMKQASMINVTELCHQAKVEVPSAQSQNLKDSIFWKIFERQE